MRFLTKILEKDDSYEHIILSNKCNNNLAKSNPSIIFNNNILFVNFRCIDYLSYISFNEKYVKNINGWISSNKVTSNNYIGYFEDNKLQKIFKKVNLSENYKFKYNGLEDAIFIKWDDVLYLCGTRCDIDDNKGRFCIYELDNNYNISNEIIVRDVNYINEIEKHWSPVEDMPFTFIKWNNPTEVVEVDKNTGDIIERTVQISESNIQGLRGNCQTVKYKNGYLSIVHDTKRYFTKKSELIPSYKHYFVQYDRDFNIIRISNPFNFEVNDIEFCCGLQIYNNNIYISYSIYDTIPVLIKFNESLIEHIFKNTEDFDEIPVSNIYENGKKFLKMEEFYSAAACFSRVFSNTDNKELEYQALMRFCICLLAIKYKGVNLFSNDVTMSFIDNLLLLKDDAAEPYYLASIYYGFIGNNDKKEFFRKQSIKYRFELPEIKRYLKMW